MKYWRNFNEKEENNVKIYLETYTANVFTMFIILTLAYILIQLTTSFEERVNFYKMNDPKISYEEAIIYGKKQDGMIQY